MRNSRIISDDEEEKLMNKAKSDYHNFLERDEKISMYKKTSDELHGLDLFRTRRSVIYETGFNILARAGSKYMDEEP